MTKTRSIPLGCGVYLPENCLTNKELTKFVDTSDEWIKERTGIERRHIAAEGQLTSDLAIKAANKALKASGLTGKDIDVIIVGTTTPDDTFPSSAVKVQAALKMNHGFAFDVQAVCSGFVYAMTIADNLIRGGEVRRALVIGADTLSRILNWEDRSTCVLFGDGAGAIVLEASEQNGEVTDRGILGSVMHSDGRLRELLYVNGGPSRTKEVGKVVMRGQEIFKHAVNNLASVAEEVLEKVGLTSQDIDWIIPHPLALSVAISDGRVKKGDLLLVEAMGGGLTWGSIVIRW